MEPRNVFISHSEQDGLIARALAAELRALHLTTWTYEEDGVAGISYLTQIHAAIEECQAFVLLASPKSVNAHQVIREVERAYEREKVIIPARIGMSHQEFIASNPILTMACGTTVTLVAEEGQLSEVAQRIASAVRVSTSLVEEPRAQPSESKPVEPLPSVAKGPENVPLTPAPSARPEMVAQAPRVLATMPQIPEPSGERTKAPDEVSAVSISVAPAWLWPSIWVAVVGQVIWASAVAYDLIASAVFETKFLKEGLFSHNIAPGLPLVVLACGLVLSRLLIRFRRSGDARQIEGPTNLLLMVTAVFIIATHTFLATAFLPDMTMVTWIDIPGRSPYFLLFNIVCLALAWNGLSVVRRDARAQSTA